MLHADPLAIAAEKLEQSARPRRNDWWCELPACDGKPHEGYDYRHARSEQRPPAWDWDLWLILAGRGFGKTRTGAEWLVDAMRAPGAEASWWAVIAPTAQDWRDTCIEGPSGVESVLKRHGIHNYRWNRSLGELILPDNEARIKCVAGETPERLRGPNYSGAWGDEPASWKYVEDTFDQLQFTLRAGQRPQTCITGTPKPIRLLKKLVHDARQVTAPPPGDPRAIPLTAPAAEPEGGWTDEDLLVHLTRGSTYANLDNLSPTFRRQVIARYEGTRLGRQELNAEILDDVPGALWTLSQLDGLRVRKAPTKAIERSGDDGKPVVAELTDLVRVVVGVDPSGSGDTAEDEQNPSDEIGIVTVGRGPDGHAYVVDDRSAATSPAKWGRRAVSAYRDHAADCIVAERNFGGDMVAFVIRSVDKGVKVKMVSASRAKNVRAEPIAALYEQCLVHHVGFYGKLEEQMTQWTPDSGDSPDRMDALVWALTELMLGNATGQGFAEAWQRMAAAKQDPA